MIRRSVQYQPAAFVLALSRGRLQKHQNPASTDKAIFMVEVLRRRLDSWAILHLGVIYGRTERWGGQSHSIPVVSMNGKRNTGSLLMRHYHSLASLHEK